MTTTKTTTRVNSVQHDFGRTRGWAMGTLPTGVSHSAVINSTERVSTLYGELETDKERKGFFDEFLKRQRSGFSEAWMCIYQTVDLIRENDWYWKDAGFDSFEAFWQEQGQALFGKWAELEATYQYAHMAAPQLFEVNYDEAKALAQQLARFRTVAPAMTKADAGRIGGKSSKACASRASNPVNPSDFIPEMNSAEWRDGFERGRNSSKDAAGDSIKRFARLRRDHSEIADQFLAGEFVKRFKNGKPPVPDLKAAEVAAGIRKEGEPTRQRDGVAYAMKLASKFNTKQLKQLQAYINQLLESRR